MVQSYFSSHTSITVAVGFDRHTDALVKLGAGLARSLGKKLCLVHVTSPLSDVRLARPFAIPAVVWDKLPEQEGAARAEARQRLTQIAASLPKDLAVEVQVATGVVGQTLSAEAAQAGSCLLIVGASFGEARFIPTGFSTGLTLMSTSSVPVMVVDTEAHVPDLTRGLRILLADDLGEDSETAVAFAAGLGDGAIKAWIHHVHVSAFDAANLRTALENAAAAAHVALSPVEAAEVFRAVKAEQVKRIEGRFGEYREYLEAKDSEYTTEVVAGGVPNELAEVVRAFHPDVLVFGRHKGWHAKPFSFGRMPFRTMLAYRRPVIVVPNL